MKIKSILNKVNSNIAPLWSLENYVAVNPYQGMANKSFKDTAKYLNILSGIKSTMPLDFYIEAYDNKKIFKEDILKAMKSYNYSEFITAEDFIQSLKQQESNNDSLVSFKTFNQFVSYRTAFDWSSLIVDRVSLWAAAYFDKNQVLWRTTESTDVELFLAWKKDAVIDKTPEILGLMDFRNTISSLPDDPYEVIDFVTVSFGVKEQDLQFYLHALYLNVGGWSSYISGLDWDNDLYCKKTDKLSSFLAILLAWEYGLKNSLKEEYSSFDWENNKQSWSSIFNSTQNQVFEDLLVLQEAYDNACQRCLIEKLDNKISVNKPKAKVQAIFCIDVRSELYRRNLEKTSDTIQTIGFAGFFAFSIKYQPIGFNESNNQCPVLIPAGATIKEIADNGNTEKIIEARKINYQVEKIWKSFKLGAVSCFSFVGPVGLAYLPKLISDTFGWTRPVAHPSFSNINKKLVTDVAVNEAIPLKDQIAMAKGALTAMSLTKDFAKLVLIVGHGSSTVNNPHATGLDCGACGGHTGEANAKVAVKILNNLEVRVALRKEAIIIPETTLFVAAQHDTTTDEVTLFNENNFPKTHSEDLEELKQNLSITSEYARLERSLRFNIQGKAIGNKVKSRGNDWSQVMPEWGLAGCNTFVVAPRERTLGINFGGKSFLHSYDWKKDKDFKILELIITAPMVVTSWINLQYYASTVDPKVFGAGNKTLHNVTGGMGVLEGYAGDLKVGLPIQSVHDGKKWQHLPEKLNVCIEAPQHAIEDILKKHKAVKDLCDNNWIKLLIMDKEGKITKRYKGNLQWESVKVQVPESSVSKKEVAYIVA